MGIIQNIQERFITLVDVGLFLKSLSKKTEIDAKTLLFFIDKEAFEKSIDLILFISSYDFSPPNKTLSKPILKKINQVLHGSSFYIALREKHHEDRLLISLEQLKKIDEELEITDDCCFLFNKYNFKQYERQLITGDNQVTHRPTDQVQALQARIAELEQELQNLKKPEAQTEAVTIAENYNPTERETHLQMIAVLSMKYAEQNKSSLMTEKGKIINSTLANILAKESQELFTSPRKAETFRPRIAEALKTYLPQAE